MTPPLCQPIRTVRATAFAPTKPIPKQHHSNAEFITGMMKPKSYELAEIRLQNHYVTYSKEPTDFHSSKKLPYHPMERNLPPTIKARDDEKISDHSPNEMKKIRCVVIEDHLMIREMLIHLLSRNPEIQIVGEAGNGNDGWDLCRHLKPDLICLDLYLPGIDGQVLAERIYGNLPQTKIVVITAVRDPRVLQNVASLGVAAIVHKTQSIAALEIEINKVIKGRTQPGGISKSYVNDSKDTTPLDSLSKRELQVLRCIGNGLSNKQIGSFLCISERTVETHRKNIVLKLELRGSELLRFAVLNASVPSTLEAE
jgi:NarL family two-component system response regulator LiaR